MLASPHSPIQTSQFRPVASKKTFPTVKGRPSAGRQSKKRPGAGQTASHRAESCNAGTSVAGSLFQLRIEEHPSFLSGPVALTTAAAARRPPPRSLAPALHGPHLDAGTTVGCNRTAPRLRYQGPQPIKNSRSERVP